MQTVFYSPSEKTRIERWPVNLDRAGPDKMDWNMMCVCVWPTGRLHFKYWASVNMLTKESSVTVGLTAAQYKNIFSPN
jgi:hypothetical protein